MNVAIVGIALITDRIIREGKSKIVCQETVEDGILYVSLRGESVNNMLKEDEKILQHLQPYNMDLSDTYFCSIYYKNKNMFMYSVLEKVTNWAEKNGGKVEKLSDKKIIGERKGFVIRIIFPCYGKRDMKNIMASLY